MKLEDKFFCPNKFGYTIAGKALFPGALILFLIIFAAPASAKYTTSALDKITISTDLNAILIEKEDSIDNSNSGPMASPGISSGLSTELTSEQPPVTASGSIEPSNDVATQSQASSGETPSATPGPKPTTIDIATQTTSSGAVEVSDVLPAQSASDSDETQLAASEKEPMIVDSAQQAAIPEPGEPSWDELVKTDGDSDNSQLATADAALEITETVSEQESLEEIIRNGLNKTIQGWSFAWANQDIDRYLSFYAEDFQPENTQLSRSAWVEQRKVRLLNPRKIEISVSEIELQIDNEPIKRAEFQQRYKSDYYQDNILKSLEFVSQDDQWKIISEKTVQVLP